MNRFLRNSSFLRNQLRNLISPLLQDLPTAFLFVDDSVQDKRYSRFIEGAKRQYPGAAHGSVTDICLVNPAHRSGPAGNFLPLDHRVHAPGQDGLTKTRISRPCSPRSWQKVTSWLGHSRSMSGTAAVTT